MATDHRGREVHGGKRTDDEHYEHVMSMRRAQAEASRAGSSVFNPNVTDRLPTPSTGITKAEHSALVSGLADMPAQVKSKTTRKDGRVKTPNDSNIDSYPETITY
jgi:hypothetical protein